MLNIFDKNLILEDIKNDIGSYIKLYSDQRVNEEHILKVHAKLGDSYNRSKDIKFLMEVQNELTHDFTNFPIVTVNNRIFQRESRHTFLEEYTPSNWRGFFTTALGKGYIALNISEFRTLYKRGRIKSIEASLRHETIHYQQYLGGKLEMSTMEVKWMVPGEEFTNKDIDNQPSTGNWLLDTLRLPWEQETYLTCHPNRILRNLNEEELNRLREMVVPSLKHLLINL